MNKVMKSTKKCIMQGYRTPQTTNNSITWFPQPSNTQEEDKISSQSLTGNPTTPSDAFILERFWVMLKETNFWSVMKNTHFLNLIKKEWDLELEEICMEFLLLSNQPMVPEAIYLSESTQKNKN